jgi:ArsR family transcriptional regulator
MKQQSSQNGQTCQHEPPVTSAGSRAKGKSAVVAPLPTRQAVERAARIFRALGDGPRLLLLQHLRNGEVCVGELVESLGEKFSTISQRLRILRSEGLVHSRRDGLHVYYALADAHVQNLVANALDHAEELLHPRQATEPQPAARTQRVATSRTRKGQS